MPAAPVDKFCTRSKTEGLENTLEVDVGEYATRGLHGLVFAYKKSDGHDNGAVRKRTRARVSQQGDPNVFALVFHQYIRIVIRFSS